MDCPNDQIDNWLLHGGAAVTVRSSQWTSSDRSRPRADVVTARRSGEQAFEPCQFLGAILADFDAVPIGLGDRVGCL